jgi:hypothetical protein
MVPKEVANCFLEETNARTVLSALKTLNNYHAPEWRTFCSANVLHPRRENIAAKAHRLLSLLWQSSVSWISHALLRLTGQPQKKRTQPSVSCRRMETVRQRNNASNA